MLGFYLTFVTLLLSYGSFQKNKLKWSIFDPLDDTIKVIISYVPKTQHIKVRIVCFLCLNKYTCTAIKSGGLPMKCILKALLNEIQIQIKKKNNN